MDKLQRRALGFAVWVILGSHRDPTTRLLRPPAAGFGRMPCACRSWFRLCLWNGGNGSDEPQMATSV